MEYQQNHRIVIDDRLSDLEQQLKNYHESHPKEQLDLLPGSPDALHFIEPTTQSNKSVVLLETTLDEDHLIDAGKDVALYRHQRYLPAIQHHHNFFEIIVVINGHCTNLIGSTPITMLQGDICIIPPDVTHALKAFTDDALILNILIRSSTFQKSFLPPEGDDDLISHFFIQALYGKKKNSYLFCRTGNDMNVLNFAIYAYDEMMHPSKYQSRMLNSIITAFFISILKDHEQNILVSDNKGCLANEDIIFILRYLQEQFSTITMKELSAFFNYSERQMQRILLTYTGMSFRDNVRKMKMSQSAHLLTHTTLKVSAIAKAVGYSDTSNFRYEFKKYYHKTPSEFRKECSHAHK